MTPEEVAKWKENYQINSPYLRGFLLDRFSMLENELETYIIVFFFGNPNKEFHFRNVILERMTFENKLTAIQSIFKKLNIEDDKLIKEITTLKNIRNAFAHKIQMVPWRPNKSVITFAYSRDTNKIIGYSQKEYQSFIDRIDSVSFTLLKMWRDLFQTKWGGIE
jgi:hypothetical protein